MLAERGGYYVVRDCTVQYRTTVIDASGDCGGDQMPPITAMHGPLLPCAAAQPSRGRVLIGRAHT